MSEIKINIYQDEDNVEHYQDYLNDYYLPIIKGRAILLYTLLKNSVNKKISESNILSLLSFSKGEYIESRKTLEALNLIETYKHIENDSSYIILVKPVLTPEKFFNKKHLRILLLNSFNNDEEKLKKVEEKYALKYSLVNYENISSSLLDVFEIKQNNSSLDSKTNYIFKSKNESVSVSSNFSYSIFLKKLKKISQINAKMINDNEEKRIQELASIYSINEEEMARYINTFYDVNNKENHINFKKLEDEIMKNQMFNTFAKNDLNSKKIRFEDRKRNNDTLISYYKSLSPLEFLRETLNGKEPSKFEKNIIQTLISEYNLSSDMINCLLDYSLNKDNNHLYKNNVITYLGPILRNDVHDVYEMIDYLYNEDSYSKKEKRFNKTKNDSKLFDENLIKNNSNKDIVKINFEKEEDNNSSNKNNNNHDNLDDLNLFNFDDDNLDL